jgi:hypothetical protein
MRDLKTELMGVPEAAILSKGTIPHQECLCKRFQKFERFCWSDFGERDAYEFWWENVVRTEKAPDGPGLFY